MRTRPVKHSPFLWVALVVLLVSATTTQVVLEGKLQRPVMKPGVNWIQSPGLMRRLAFGFNAIWADVYWIRAVQYFGSTSLSTDEHKNFDQLYPLLDITTSLDPHFNIAIDSDRFCCPKDFPTDPGIPIKRFMLLQKGMREMPDKWQYYHDAGFINYWWRRDAQAAADWFMKASKMPGAPNWLRRSPRACSPNMGSVSRLVRCGPS
jgi:hypothetical protein